MLTNIQACTHISTHTYPQIHKRYKKANLHIFSHIQPHMYLAGVGLISLMDIMRSVVTLSLNMLRCKCHVLEANNLLLDGCIGVIEAIVQTSVCVYLLYTTAHLCLFLSVCLPPSLSPSNTSSVCLSLSLSSLRRIVILTYISQFFAS